jgi:hypothetical protein
MTNVKARVEGTLLHITIDTAAKLGDSSTGKSITCAAAQVNGKDLGLPEDFRLGLNAYFVKPKAGK